ncbi:MAG: carbohydrate ABC transporter permease [Planctomycetota bacterium]|nr:carbohydrate ABC transporter permease [Planctomycetota bacterium]
MSPSTDSHRSLPGRATIYVLLVLVTLTALLPIAYMVSISTGGPEPDAAFMEGGVAATGERVRDNFGHVLTDENTDFPLYLRNTLWIALLGVLGTTISSAVVAYGFSRVRWRGRGPAFIVMISTMMIPFPVVMVPLFTMFREIGWIGTFAPLWVPAWFGNAFSIFLLRQFFLTIPRELDDASRIDGCGHVRNFIHVILPLSIPALLVVALFHFMFVWNDFLGPLVFLTHRDQFTLALGLQLYLSKLGQTPWNLLMAATTVMVAPVLVLFVLMQRTFVEGISTAGSKG